MFQIQFCRCTINSARHGVAILELRQPSLQLIRILSRRLWWSRYISTKSNFHDFKLAQVPWMSWDDSEPKIMSLKLNNSNFEYCTVLFKNFYEFFLVHSKKSVMYYLNVAAVCKELELKWITSFGIVPFVSDVICDRTFFAVWQFCWRFRDGCAGRAGGIFTNQLTHPKKLDRY